MHDDELDALLRRIPDTSEAQQEPKMRADEGVLIAYRDGLLGAAEVEAVERLLANDAEARQLLRDLSSPVDVSDVDAVMGRLPAGNVVPLRRRRVRLAVGALAAAALAFVVLPSREGRLGAYQLEVEGAQAQTRGAPTAGPYVVSEEGRLVLRLRAQEATDDGRVLGVFVEGADARLHRVPASVASSRGSFEATVEGSAWAGAVGSHVVWLHVARDEAAVSKWEGKAAHVGEGWWRVDVERRE